MKSPYPLRPKPPDEHPDACEDKDIAQTVAYCVTQPEPMQVLIDLVLYQIPIEEFGYTRELIQAFLHSGLYQPIVEPVKSNEIDAIFAQCLDNAPDELHGLASAIADKLERNDFKFCIALIKKFENTSCWYKKET